MHYIHTHTHTHTTANMHTHTHLQTQFATCDCVSCLCNMVPCGLSWWFVISLYVCGRHCCTDSCWCSAGAILMNCSMDLPARAMVMNMKQWNGISGCLYCEDEGTVIGGDHLHRYWPQQESSVARSHASLLNMLKQLQELELPYEHAYTKPSLHNYANALWEEISHYIRAIGN